MKQTKSSSLGGAESTSTKISAGLGLGYQILMLLTTSSQMGHEWPNCSKSWPRQDQSKCLVGCIANMEGSLVLITFRSVSNSGHELPNAGGFDRSTAVAVIITKHLYLLHSPIQFWRN